MSTHSIIGIVIAAVAVIGGGYLLAQRNSSDGMMQDTSERMAGSSSEETMMNDDKMNGEDAMMSDDAAMEGPASAAGGGMADDGAMMKKGSYESYAANKLALADSGDVVLFFRASWCPTCKALDASIRSDLSAIPSGLTILDVDYDNSAALKQKYGVTYQHTLVQVDSSGKLIKKWSGSPTLAALVAEVR